MRGVYTASVKIASVSAAKTLMYLTAGANGIICELLYASVTNESNATNWQGEILFCKIATLGTPTATGITPFQHEAGDQAAASTVKQNVTASEPTYATVGHQEGFASVNGWYWDPTTTARYVYVSNAASWGIKLVTITGGVATDLNVLLVFREIG